MTELRDTFGLEALRQELIRDEGLVLHVYKDPGSGRAIGVGRNLDTQGLNGDELAELALAMGLGGHESLKGDSAVAILSKGITEPQAMLLLDNDIKDRAHQLDAYLPWWRLLSPVRQRVLLNMAFEMGTHGLMRAMGPAWLTYLQLGDYDEVAAMMEDSPWGKRIPKRPHELAQMMRLDKPVDRSGEPVA